MNCEKCGSPMTPDMLFCAECGHKNEPVNTQNGIVGYCKRCGAGMKNGDIFCPECGASSSSQSVPSSPAPSPKKNNTAITALIISLAALIAVATICLSFYFITKESNDDNEPKTKTSRTAKPAEKETSEKKTEGTKVVGKNIDKVVNDFIQANAVQGDISVAVLDNQSNITYSSAYSDASYTSWGFYLPIYLSYGQQSGYDWQVRENIMSADAGVCNQSANRAIQEMGGLGAATQTMARNFNTANTFYGRYFGDTNASSDNYTTANDAVKFLKILNNNGEYAKLSYHLNSFGITPPAGAAVYAQIGTENRNVRSNLNLFAIVKGPHSDYCVAILSQNSAGRYLSQLLQTIHFEMEK